MVELSPLNALLVSLARSSDVLDISKNTYVPPPGDDDGPDSAGSGTRVPSSGMLADLEHADGANASTGAARTGPRTSQMSRVAALVLAAESEQPEPDAVASRSLTGLRPPQTASSAAALTSANDPDAGTDRADGPTSHPGPAASLSATPRANDASSAPPLADAAATKSTDDTEASTSPNAQGEPAFGLSGDRAMALHGEASLAGTRAASNHAAAHDLSSAVEDAAALHKPSPEQTRQRDRSDSPGLGERTRSAAAHDALPSPDRLRADAPTMPVGDAAPVDGFATQAESAVGQQLERAGVIASFILNAAIIPGWPPPRPFAVPGQEELLGNLARATALPTDAEFFAFLKQRGAKPALLARLRELLARLGKSRRLRVMLGLAALGAAVESVLDAIEEELTRLAHSDEEDDSPEPEEGWRRLSV